MVAALVVGCSANSSDGARSTSSTDPAGGTGGNGTNPGSGGLGAGGSVSGGAGGTTSSGGAGGSLGGAGGTAGTAGHAGTGGASGAGGTGGVQDAPRPRLLSTELELHKVRDVVMAPASHPMKQGWDKLTSVGLASLSHDPTPYEVVHVVGSGTSDEERALRNDAVAAYAHALQWVVTRDTQHSAKAIEILNAWSAVLEDVVPEPGSPDVQDELEVAWYAPIWLSAAEIVRFHRDGAAGWLPADVTAFDGMVSLFRTKADAWAGSQGCCPNQALSVVLSRLAIAVYTDDSEYFDEAIEYFVDSVLARSIADDGEVLEINRISGGDCGHATYNIEGIFDIAEIAWHHGVDLYSDPRLPLGLEYLAECITSGVPTSSEGFVTCSSMRPVSIEVAYNHYMHRVGGMALPETAELLEVVRPSDQGTGKFIPWDTLTHADLDMD